MAAGLPDATSVCVYGTYPAVHLIPKPSDATSEGFFVVHRALPGNAALIFRKK